jgi:ribosomal protein S18 acetylase RimI-like enzyme
MIKSAIPSEAPIIAQLLVNAMKELAVQYANDPDPQQAIPIFKHFVAREDNQYSYQNMRVCYIDDELVGVISGYDGGKFKELRKPFLSYLKDKIKIDLEDVAETEDGEYYIDALSVSPSVQGRGIGKELIKDFIEEIAKEGHTKIGLLVNTQNSLAKNLYESLDFVVVNEKQILGESYFHMQFIP